MSRPDPNEVQKEFNKVIENVGELIKFLQENSAVKFVDVMERRKSIDIGIISVQTQTQFLVMLDKKYSRISEDIRKLMAKLFLDNSLEVKYLGKTRFGGTDFMQWEPEYQRGKFRKDLIKFYKKIESDMVKINKKIA